MFCTTFVNILYDIDMDGNFIKLKYWKVNKFSLRNTEIINYVN